MRRPLGPSNRNVSRDVSFAAPTGGWNARDPLAMMAMKDAQWLENFFVRGTSVEARKGCKQIGTLPHGSKVGTLFPYNPSNGVFKLFAATSEGFYDVSSGYLKSENDIHTSVNFATTDSNSAFEYVNVATAGGNFLVLVNGTNSPILYDGTTFKYLNATSSPPLTGTGLDVTKLKTVMAFKSRLYFTAKNSLSFWYSDVNSIAGTLHEFPLQVLANKGGYLVNIIHWTYSTSFSISERIALITSEGQVIVYDGYDPSNSDNWTLIGVFDLPKPIGVRCLVNLGGDAGILTANGLILMSQALRSPAPGVSPSLSDKIRIAYQECIDSYGSMTGWEVVNHLNYGALLINVPAPTGRKQLVLNTVGQTWSLFTGWDADTLAAFNGTLCFASKEGIFLAWTGNTDSGNPIIAQAETAYMTMGSSGRSKHVKLIKPNFTLSAPVTTSITLNTEFSASGISSVSPSTGHVAMWDSARWDQDNWDAIFVDQKWRQVNSRPGSYVSIRLRVELPDISLTWNAVDCIVEVGDLL